MPGVWRTWEEVEVEVEVGFSVVDMVFEIEW